MQQLVVIFATVFLAELGDKTQLATPLFSTDKQHHPFMIFFAAASALVAVVSGLSDWLMERTT